MSSKTTGIVTLHCEILDIILEELQLLCDDDSQDLKETLCACRLVCTWLNEMVSPLLFRTLELTRFTYWTPVNNNYREDREERCQELLSLFESNSNIAPFVRSFHISTYAPHKDRARHWMFKSKALPCILEKLDNLKTFTLRGHRGQLEWSYFSIALSRTLEGLFRRPSVSRLGFSDVNGLPLHYISTCTNLRHLAITDGTHEYGDVWWESVVPSTAHRTLEISPRVLCRPSQLWATDDALFERSEYWSNVTVLKLKMDYIHSRALRFYDEVNWNESWCNFLRNLPRLRELEVGVSSEGQWVQAYTWPSAASLVPLGYLEAIRITVSIAYTNNFDSYIPQIITKVLKSPHPMAKVTVVHITILLFCDDTINRITQGWKKELKLDEWLQRTYPMLRTMILEFCLSENSGMDDVDEDRGVKETADFSRVAMKEMAERFWPVLASSSVVLKIITPTDVFEL